MQKTSNGVKKFIILILGLSFIAASCDITGGLLDLGGGVRGILKSEDNAETYNPANALQNKGDISGVSVNSLSFDTSNPDILYLGSSQGLYKSEDAAKSWRYILSGIGVTNMVVDPYQSNIIYAAGIVGQNGKIIKSLDGGISWVDIFTEPSKNNTVTALAINPGNSSVVLAGLTTGEIIRSSDGGHTWQAVRDFADKIMEIKFGTNGSAYALTFTKGLQKSTDQGTNWNPITKSLTNDNLFNQNQAVSSVAAFFDLALDKRQAGVLYLGTQQGLFRTVNDGNTWSVISLPQKNASLRVSAASVNPNNSNNILAAVGSIMLKSINGGVSWETKVLPIGGEVRTILINSQSNNLIYLGLGSTR